MCIYIHICVYTYACMHAYMAHFKKSDAPPWVKVRLVSNQILRHNLRQSYVNLPPLAFE